MCEGVVVDGGRLMGAVVLVALRHPLLCTAVVHGRGCGSGRLWLWRHAHGPLVAMQGHHLRMLLRPTLLLLLLLVRDLAAVLKRLVVGQGVAGAVVLVADVALVLVGVGGGVLVADVGREVGPLAEPFVADGALLLTPRVHCNENTDTLINTQH